MEKSPAEVRIAGEEFWSYLDKATRAGRRPPDDVTDVHNNAYWRALFMTYLREIAQSPVHCRLLSYVQDRRGLKERNGPAGCATILRRYIHPSGERAVPWHLQWSAVRSEVRAEGSLGVLETTLHVLKRYDVEANIRLHPKYAGFLKAISRRGAAA